MKALLAALAFSAVVPLANAIDIGPGSPAPALSIKSWIKGEPVPALAKDKTYVVEFWATWCGPCRESIPHLTDVAHKNTDVTFIGVSVWEDDKNGSIKKFVDDMGNKMDYHVGYSGNQDGMAVSWMKSATQNGIPAAFIVKNGVIQWIGHPMEIEAPLKQVKAGTFDLKQFQEKFAKSTAKTKAQMAMQDEIGSAIELFDAGKRQEAKTKLAALVAKSPEAKPQAESIQFQWLAKEDPKAWDTKANELAKAKAPAGIEQLRHYALAEASNPKGDRATARKAIILALEASGSDQMTLQYAMAVYKGLGDGAAGVACANKLLKNMPDDPNSAEFRKAIEQQKSELEAMTQK